MDISSSSSLSFVIEEDANNESTATPVAGLFGPRARKASAPLPTGAQTTTAMPPSILDVWGEIAKAHMSVRLYQNLVRLAGAKDGRRGPGSKALTAAAIKNFLHFWLKVRDQAAEPHLTLAPDGTLMAEWYKSELQRLDVRFSQHTTFFGLLTPKNIIEGADSMDTVAAILKLHPSQPLTWKS